MFSWYQYLIVSLIFSHLGFWSGNLFLIAPFPDLCLLVPFVELHCLKPHAKFQDYRPSGSGEEVFFYRCLLFIAGFGSIS